MFELKTAAEARYYVILTKQPWINHCSENNDEILGVVVVSSDFYSNLNFNQLTSVYGATSIEIAKYD